MFFSREDAPASVGLVFDSSGSMKSNLPVARQAVQALMRTLDPEDEAFVATVSDRAEFRSGFTNDLRAIQNAILFSPAKGRTALVDGVYMALHRIRTAHNPRKALIVISDGQDNNSRYTLDELTSYALEADTQIYTIAMYDKPATLDEAIEVEDGKALLRQLSEKTGGVHYGITNPNELPDAMAKVGTALHNLYVLGYYTPDDAMPGQFRRIRVKLNVPKGVPRLQVYSRRGYYAPQS